MLFINCLIDIYFKQDIIKYLEHFIHKIYDIKLNNHIKVLIYKSTFRINNWSFTKIFQLQNRINFLLIFI